MRLETILNAMTSALVAERTISEPHLPNQCMRKFRKERQFFAFRARILRMDVEKDIIIATQKTFIEMTKWKEILK